MDKSLIVMTAATLLSGVHGNNGNHTADAIKKAVSTAAEIAKEVDAVMKALEPPAEPPKQE